MELRRKPLSADKNLLLNYLTPWSGDSLFRSLSAGHFPVALGVTGGFILKVLIVVSTGLFALEARHFDSVVEITVRDRFNISEVTQDNFDQYPVDPGVDLWAINAGNVAFPPGINLKYATPTLVAPILGNTPTYLPRIKMHAFQVKGMQSVDEQDP